MSTPEKSPDRRGRGSSVKTENNDTSSIPVKSNGAKSPAEFINGLQAPLESTAPATSKAVVFPSTLMGSAYNSMLAQNSDKPDVNEIGKQVKRDAEKDQLQSDIEILDAEYFDLDQKRSEEDRFIDEPNHTVRKAGIALLAILVAFFSTMMVMNAARFAVETTQSWSYAVFFTAIFAGLALGLEIYADHLAKRIAIVRSTMAWILIIAGSLLIFVFSDIFTYIPGIEDLSAITSGTDYRLLFILQTIAELALSFGLIAKIRDWIEVIINPVDNPIYLRMTVEIDKILGVIRAKRERIAEIDADSAVYAARLERAHEYDALITNFSKS